MKKFFIPIFSLCLIAFSFTSCDPDEPDPNDPTTPSDTTKPKDTTKPNDNVFVSKTAQNRNVLLEEFTGNKCPNCPAGHKIADQLHTTYGDKFLSINIHTESFSDSVYKIPEGVALKNAFYVTGYPTGIISRELVETDKGYVFAISRSLWGNVASQIMAMPAYVNVAAKSTIESSGRKLTCEVQAYFTDSSPVATGLNFINIAIIQNNIWGSQSGYSYYPEMYNETTQKYRHNHMLRALITGVEGEAMPENKKGTLYKKTFTYSIPEKINNVEAVLSDMEIIVYVTQNTPTTYPNNFTDPDKQMPRVINVCKSALTLK